MRLFSNCLPVFALTTSLVCWASVVLSQAVVRSVQSQSDKKQEAPQVAAEFKLKRDEAAGATGYAVSAPRYLNWHPRLDFVFHRLTVSSGLNTSVN